LALVQYRSPWLCRSPCALCGALGGHAESKIELDEADRAAVVSSVRATAAGLSADSTLDVNAAVASVGVKDSYKLSDLTYFDVFQKARKA